jgi:hypothetical protein
MGDWVNIYADAHLQLLMHKVTAAQGTEDERGWIHRAQGAVAAA